MNLRNSSYYLYGDQEVSAAFVHGFLTAMRVCKHAVPIAGNTGEIASWVAATAVANDLEGDRQHRARVRKILAVGNVRRYEFRGMLLDCARVNERGREVDDAGHMICCPKNHRPYPHAFYTDLCGNYRGQTKPDGYCRRVRYLDVLGDDGMTLFQIRSDDAIAMEEALRRDILLGDPINSLYLEKCQEGENLEEYAHTITSALMESRMLENMRRSADNPEPSEKREGYVCSRTDDSRAKTDTIEAATDGKQDEDQP